MSAKSFKRQLQKREDYKGADTLNNEGHPAFKRKGAERLREILFLGNVGNTFYVSQANNIQEKMKDLERLMEQIDSETAADLIVSARKEGLFRTIPIAALALLRKKDPKKFREIFSDVVLTGNDLKDFLNINHIVFEGFGAAVKKAVNAWLAEKGNEFYALKYRNQLADAIALARPRISSMENGKVLEYIYAVKKDIEKKRLKEIKKELPQIKAAEKFKKLVRKGKLKKAIKKAKEGRLPADLMIGMAGDVKDQEFWEAVADNMGTMQLLKYLNKLDSVGVDVSKFKERLSYDNIKKAKIFPYRLFVAWENGTPKVKELMKDVINDVERHELFDEKWISKSWAICPDVSASMTWKGYGSTVVPAEVAGFFSSLMAKQLGADKILGWDQYLHPIKTKEKGVFELYEKVVRSGGGGTAMNVPIDHLLSKREKRDIVVLITDSEHWYGDRSLKRAWMEYKDKVNGGAKLVVIEVVGYGTSQVDEEFAKQYDVYTVFGWSDSVFQWIEMKVL